LPPAEEIEAPCEGFLSCLGRVGEPARAWAVQYWLNAIAEDTLMLKWALIFLVISIVAGAFGFTGISAGAASIAKLLFGLFLILAILFFILLVTGINVFS